MDGQVLPEELPDHLCVPPDFKLLEYNWTAPSEAQKDMSQEQMVRLHSCLKLFIRAMLVGVFLQLRLDAEDRVGRGGIGNPMGQNIDAVAMLNKGLSTMILSTGAVQRTVPLESIRWVRPPGEDGGGVTWFVPSERGQMVVLRLAGNCFLRFRFGQQEQAAYFGTCMRLLLKASK